jgi:hypothetical protein
MDGVGVIVGVCVGGFGLSVGSLVGVRVLVGLRVGVLVGVAVSVGVAVLVGVGVWDRAQELLLHAFPCELPHNSQSQCADDVSQIVGAVVRSNPGK